MSAFFVDRRSPRPPVRIAVRPERRAAGPSWKSAEEPFSANPDPDRSTRMMRNVSESPAARELQPNMVILGGLTRARDEAAGDESGGGPAPVALKRSGFDEGDGQWPCVPTT
jgi:hypothetical protein